MAGAGDGCGATPTPPPTGPSALHAPVVKERIKLRDSGAPRPMPMPGDTGFPTATHRSEKRYARRGAAATSTSTTGISRSSRAAPATAAGTAMPGVAALPRGAPSAGPAAGIDEVRPAADILERFSRGEFDAAGREWEKQQQAHLSAEMLVSGSQDPVADTTLQVGMHAEGGASLIAAAAVMLRSRSNLEKSRCLARLLDTPEETLRRDMSHAEPTVLAQFILAVRLSLDAANPSQLADVIRLLGRLTHRRTEADLLSLLHLTQWNGLLTPLASWLDERTLYGLGTCSVAQVLDPIDGAPTANLWDPLESIHELASLVKCDILEGFAKAQYATRLRHLLVSPPGATPWVPQAVMDILGHISLSKKAAEALAAAPQLIETVCRIVSPEAATLSDQSAAMLSEGALAVLHNMARSSSEVADIISESSGWVRAVQVIHVTCESHGKIEGVRLSHAKAALAFIRTGILLRVCTRNTAVEIFSALAMLSRQGVPEAFAVLDAQGLSYSFMHIMEGQQQVGLIHFGLSDVIGTVVETVSRGGLSQGSSESDKASAAVLLGNALSVISHSIQVATSTVGTMTTVIEIFNVLLKKMLPKISEIYPVAACASLILQGLPALYGEGSVEGLRGAVPSNATAWPPSAGAPAGTAVAAAFLHTSLLKLCSTLLESKLTLAAAHTEVTPLIRESLQTVYLPEILQHLCGARASAAGGLASAAVQHAEHPKQLSRVHSAVLRSPVELASIVAHLCLRGSGGLPLCNLEAFPGCERDLQTMCMNLSLFVQPSDGVSFRLMLGVVFGSASNASTTLRFPALCEYFNGAYDLRPPQKDSLFLSFRPGRLEPQMEWPFLPAVDSSHDDAEGRFLTVQTSIPVSDTLVQEWGAWLGELALGGDALYLTRLDWREAVMRVAGVLPTSELTACLLPYLSEVVRRRCIVGGGDSGSSSAPSTSTSPEWQRRLGESPLQIVKRALHGFESDKGYDEVHAAVILLLLAPEFPADIRKAVVATLSTPQLAHVAGTCFRDGSACGGIYLGLQSYLLPDDVIDTDEMALHLARMLSLGGRPVNPGNVLHVAAVDALSHYIFESDGALSFPGPHILEACSPAALRAVTLFDPIPQGGSGADGGSVPSTYSNPGDLADIFNSRMSGWPDATPLAKARHAAVLSGAGLGRSVVEAAFVR